MSSDISDVASSIKDKADKTNSYKELFNDIHKKLFGEGYEQLKKLLESKTTWNDDKETFYIQKYIKQNTSKDSKPGFYFGEIFVYIFNFF